ncbi:MAG: DoxX family protein [bacterium]
MKSIGYWAATALIALETFVGGITDLVHGGTGLFSRPPVVGIVTHLGHPVYILIILGVWKVFGAIVIAAPGLPRLKEWAYAGIIFELTGAAASYVLNREITERSDPPLPRDAGDCFVGAPTGRPHAPSARSGAQPHELIGQPSSKRSMGVSTATRGAGSPVMDQFPNPVTCFEARVIVFRKTVCSPTSSDSFECSNR